MMDTLAYFLGEVVGLVAVLLLLSLMILALIGIWVMIVKLARSLKQGREQHKAPHYERPTYGCSE